MGALRYICMSDLHAGAGTSLLTDLTRTPPFRPDFSKPSPVTHAFADALGAMLDAARGKADERPQLILLGDVLDLQMSSRDDAFASALGFLQALRDTDGLHDDILATAGNHDHALWSDARLNIEAKTIGTGRQGSKFRKATPAFTAMDTAQSRLMTALAEAAKFGRVDFRYPNIGFYNADRAVVLHHGHFVEDEYRLVSAFKDFAQPGKRSYVPFDDLSAENAGWIDFFWSTFGDASGLGRDGELFYQNMLTSTGFRKMSRRMAKKIAEVMAEHVPMGGRIDVQEMLHILARVGLDVTAGKFRDTERYWEVAPLSPGGYEGLRWYLDGPVYHQVDKELGGVPDDLSFVFGHTHKPFTERIAGTAFPQPVKTYNTGGWPLNGPRLGTAEGVAIVLIDEDLHVASLRLFTTPENGEVTAAHVESLSDCAGGQAFARDVKRWISGKAAAPAFENLRVTVQKAYQKRQGILLKLTEDEAAASRLRAAE